MAADEGDIFAIGFPSYRLALLLALPLLAGALLPISASAQTTTMHCSPPITNGSGLSRLATQNCYGDDGSSMYCTTVGNLSPNSTLTPAPQPSSISSPAQSQVRPSDPCASYAVGGDIITPPCGCTTIDYWDPVTGKTTPTTVGGGCGKPAPVMPVAAPLPPMPAPQISANDSYSTTNGVRTSAQIQSELLTAGYTGPFDVPSLLAAYQRTTASPVRPL
jgi:hypothetical protein